MCPWLLAIYKSLTTKDLKSSKKVNMGSFFARNPVMHWDTFFLKPQPHYNQSLDHAWVGSSSSSTARLARLEGVCVCVCILWFEYIAWHNGG